ncbi:hypothetical protein PENANT_c162G01204 [Penicillium antarcticum]|uniref:Terpene synthase n=1 Tax=Penicillium antarcticum TaxID=416450 RepID=A0A1V6PE14_9EURO|nr:hypothetical protein PENANT_c162G01204 [Penicillium antarcticum]
MSVSPSSLVRQLIGRCIGQQIKIPFLSKLFPGWHARFNHNDDAGIQYDLDQFQQVWIKSPVALERNRRTDSVFFARSVFPEAATEDLKIAVIWISWLYFWDDALDFNELDRTLDQISSYREEILLCIQHSLLPGDQKEDVDPVHIAPNCPAAQAWYKIGVQIRRKVTAASSQKFMHDCLREYVTATIELQMHCDNFEIMDIDSYLAIRMKTSGVYPTISMYLYRPQRFFPEITNANRTAKASGHIDNIIPLLMHHYGLSAQGAVNEAVRIIKDSFAGFHCFEAEIIALGKEHDITREVSAFLKGCIDLCMGAIQWTC